MEINWAVTWQNQQNGTCAQRRFRSAWASVQSDQSSLSAWRKLGSLATHWACSDDSNQTGRIPRLIWVFTGCTVIFLVLSWCGSYIIRHFLNLFVSPGEGLSFLHLTSNKTIWIPILIQDKWHSASYTILFRNEYSVICMIYGNLTNVLDSWHFYMVQFHCKLTELLHGSVSL